MSTGKNRGLNMTRGIIIAVMAHVACQSTSAETVHPIVTTLRVPHEGIQPQIVVGKSGAIHMLYYNGEAAAGDIFYVRSKNGGESFSNPITWRWERTTAFTLPGTDREKRSLKDCRIPSCLRTARIA
jgi:hypothetical protein